MAPIMVALPPMPFAAIIDALIESGIEVDGIDRATDGSTDAAFLCRRGSVSFELQLKNDHGTLLAAFFADLTGWKWWNFPLRILAAVPYTGQEIRLQRDVRDVLLGIGGKELDDEAHGDRRTA